MKKTFVKLAALAAVCVLAFASCEMVEPENPASENDAVEAEGNFSVTFNCVLDEPDDATKTEYHDKTIWWSAGDKVRFFQRYYKTEDATAFTNTYKDSNATASGTFCPTLSFNTPAKFPVHYMAFYPSASYAGNLKAVNGRLVPELSIPSTQSPSLLSFDPAADLLISEYIEADAARTNFDLRFKRMVALGKMKISGVDSSSPVVSVKFSAVADGNSVHLAGKSYYNIYEGNVYQESTYATAIVASYSDASAKADGDGMTVFFNCRPFELGEGDTFKVVVTTSDEATFTKEVTIPSGKSLEFVAGNGTVFSVDMSGTVPERTCDWFTVSNYTSGDYTPKYNTIYFRLASTATNWASGKYCAVTESEYAAGLSDLDALIETKGTAITSSVITGINGGSAYRLNVTNLDFNTPYFILVKSVLDDSSTGIATLQSATAVFDVRAAAVNTAGKANFYFYGTNLASMKYKFVPSANLTGVTDYSAYFDTLTDLSTATATRIEKINTSGTDSASMTGLTSGAKYRFMAKAIDNDGNVHFAYSSEITVN